MDSKSALANLSLAIISSLLFRDITCLKFLTIAYILSILKGVLGTITNLTCNSTIDDWDAILSPVCRFFYLPLIATEYCLALDMKEEKALLNLAIPVVIILGYTVVSDLLGRNILDICEGLQAIAICYSSYMREDNYGCCAGLLALYYLFGVSGYDEAKHISIMAATNILTALSLVG